MDLDDILDEIKSEQPGRVSSVSQMPADYQGMDIDLMSTPMPTDHVVSLALVLSPYEAWWLEYRLKVHLRSYRAMRWDEMEEVIKCLIMRISSLSALTNSCTEGSSIVVEEVSGLPGPVLKDSHP